MLLCMYVWKCMKSSPWGNSYHIIPYHNHITHIISYHYHIISYHYHIISYHIISYHIISYHIISYHIISYHIISYQTLFQYFVVIADYPGGGGVLGKYLYGDAQSRLQNVDHLYTCVLQKKHLITIIPHSYD